MRSSLDRIYQPTRNPVSVDHFTNHIKFICIYILFHDGNCYVNVLVFIFLAMWVIINMIISIITIICVISPWRIHYIIAFNIYLVIYLFHYALWIDYETAPLPKHCEFSNVLAANDFDSNEPQQHKTIDTSWMIWKF